MQVYNILHLGDLFELLATGFENVQPYPQLVPLHEPEYLSIEVLPLSVKQLAQTRLSRVRQGLGLAMGGAEGAASSPIDTVVRHMFRRDRSVLIPALREFTVKTEAEFGDSIAVAIPEVAELLGLVSP